MADEYNNEVFMQLCDTNGDAIKAECQTAVSTDLDDLISEYFDGEFFAVDEFRFGMSITDQDAATDAANRTGGKGVNPNAKAKTGTKQAKFGKWKSASATELKGMKFPVKVEEFSVTRRYDKASPVIFDKCAKSESFSSASIVKRKVVGDSQLQAFMKFSFEDVLVTRIQFQEADVLKETLSFVFRKMKFEYKLQRADGTLEPSGAVFLDYAAALKAQAAGAQAAGG